MRSSSTIFPSQVIREDTVESFLGTETSSCEVIDLHFRHPNEPPPPMLSSGRTPQRFLSPPQPGKRRSRVPFNGANLMDGSPVQVPMVDTSAEEDVNTMSPEQRQEYYRRMFRMVVRDVISLEAAGSIFSVISEHRAWTQVEVEHVVFTNLAVGKVRVHDSSALYRTLANYTWDGRRFRERLDISSFRNALGSMYMSLKPVSHKSATPEDAALSYCPTLLVKHIVRQVISGSSSNRDMKVSKTDFCGVCMLADISGFTKMSSMFSSKGAGGLDDLHRLTNDFVSKLVEVVYSFSGDVIAFAGDAIICVFDDADKEGGPAVVKAVLCAQALINASSLFELAQHPLRSHIALSYGEMSLAAMGGLGLQWVFLLNGGCVSHLHDAIDDALLDQVVVTAELYRALTKYCREGHSLVTTLLNSKNRRIEKFNAPFELRHPDKRLSDILTSVDPTRLADLYANIIKFVPPPALEAIQRNSASVMSELSEVTTMFLDLNSYHPEKHRDPLSLSPFFEIVQRALMETRGFLRQFLVDDKGCVVIAMWGLGSYTYENNASRALICATMIAAQCGDIKHRCSIGITTGGVYCGNIGNSFRKDYVGIGSDVNKAARFMVKARDKIYLDTATYNRIPQVAQYQLEKRQEGLMLKGLEGLADAYIYASFFPPACPIQGGQESLEVFLSPDVEEKLRLQLDKMLQQTAQKDRWTLLRSAVLGQVIFTVVEGAEGTSRSAAADYFVKIVRAADENIKVYRFRIHEKDAKASHGLLKALVAMVMEELCLVEQEAQRSFLETIVRDEMPGESDINVGIALNYLRVVLRLDWLDLSIQHHGYQNYISQNEAISDILVLDNNRYLLDDWLLIICSALLRTHRSAIVIEDAHFLDESSMVALEKIQGAHTRLSVLVTMCPSLARSNQRKLRKLSQYVENLFAKKIDVDDDDIAYLSITSNPNCTVIVVPALAEEECKQMLEGVIKDRRASMLAHNITGETLTQKVFDIAEGNPYWCAVIANFIRDYGVWEFEKTYSESLEAKEEGSSKTTVLDAFVMARLKVMPTDSQVVIKWASIFGKEFSYADLSAVLPTKFSAHLRSILDSFINFSFVTCIHESPLTYAFVNSSVQHAIYRSITPADASRHHYAVAEYLERRHVEWNSPVDYPSLSHHYTQCLVKFPEKQHIAFKYTIRAASDALNNKAYRDGLHHCYNASRIARHDAERTMINGIASDAHEQLRFIQRTMKTRIRARRQSLNTVQSYESMNRNGNWEHIDGLVRDFELFRDKTSKGDYVSDDLDGSSDSVSFVDSLSACDDTDTTKAVSNNNSDRNVAWNTEEEGGGEAAGSTLHPKASKGALHRVAKRLSTLLTVVRPQSVPISMNALGEPIIVDETHKSCRQS